MSFKDHELLQLGKAVSIDIAALLNDVRIAQRFIDEWADYSI